MELHGRSTRQVLPHEVTKAYSPVHLRIIRGFVGRCIGPFSDGLLAGRNVKKIDFSCGQSRLLMANLQGVPGALADLPIADAVAAAAQSVARCQT